MEVTRRTLGHWAVVASIALLARLLGPVVVPGTDLSVSLGAGVGFAAGVTLGPPGAVAAGAGHVGTGLVDGLGGGGTLTVVAVGLAAAWLEGSLGTSSVGPTWFVPSSASHAEWLVVAGVASLVATTVTAVATSLRWGVPAYLAAVAVGTSVLAGVLAVGVPLAAGVRRRATRSGRSDALADVHSLGSPRTSAWLVGLSVGWLALACVLDLGFALARSVPVRVYSTRYGLDVSAVLLERLHVLGHLALFAGVAATAWYVGSPAVVLGDRDGASATVVGAVRARVEALVRKR